MLVYDLEIIKLVPKMCGVRDLNYQYCEGWDDYRGMGISVIGVIDSSDLSGYFFSEEKVDPLVFNSMKSIDIFKSFSHEYLHSFPDFVREHRAQNFIGFNNHRFDDEVICANFSINFHGDYDLLKLIRIAAYGSDAHRDQPVGYNYSLAAIASANGYKKTGDCARASKLWQDGDRARVVDYCLNDCYITGKILELAISGELIDPNTNKKLEISLPKPWDYF